MAINLHNGCKTDHPSFVSGLTSSMHLQASKHKEQNSKYTVAVPPAHKLCVTFCAFFTTDLLLHNKRTSNWQTTRNFQWICSLDAQVSEVALTSRTDIYTECRTHGESRSTLKPKEPASVKTGRRLTMCLTIFARDDQTAFLLQSLQMVDRPALSQTTRFISSTHRYGPAKIAKIDVVRYLSESFFASSDDWFVHNIRLRGRWQESLSKWRKIWLTLHLFVKIRHRSWSKLDHLVFVPLPVRILRQIEQHQMGFTRLSTDPCALGTGNQVLLDTEFLEQQTSTNFGEGFPFGNFSARHVWTNTAHQLLSTVSICSDLVRLARDADATTDRTMRDLRAAGGRRGICRVNADRFNCRRSSRTTPLLSH